MQKLTFLLITVLSSITVFGHQGNLFFSQVKIIGKLYRLQDSSLIAGSISFEKLPYYDGAGFTQAGDNGQFEITLLDKNKYSFKVRKEGYLPMERVVEVYEGEALELYVKEDIVDLIKLDNLIFKARSEVITSSSFQELNELAKWMKDNSQIIIQLEGHTDIQGRSSANMMLSQARVNAIKKYLTDRKVKGKRILTKAFGGMQPLSEEDTPEVHALNRRVEDKSVTTIKQF